MAEFSKITSTEFSIDPVFSNSRFEMCGDASIIGGPTLFTVENYRYVLISPYEVISDREMLFKISTYLYHNPTIKDGLPITYFIGDINKCKLASTGFENQIVKIVSYEMINQWFPKSINEINSHVIKTLLRKQKYYGKVFNTIDFDLKLLLFIPTYLSEGEKYQAETFIKKQLFDKGLLIKRREYDNQIEFIVSEKAIDLYQEDSHNDTNLAFIAIKFADNEERIKVIQNAIAKAGYTPVIMNEYEHNNWIMPEIFHQIQISKFVVVDLSIRCDGAYYESGYAYALGKEVIHTYDEREKDANYLHFDVAQKSTIMYNSFEELEDRLIKRIKATVN